ACGASRLLGWHSSGENRWTTFAENAWITFAENRWTTFGRILTCGRLAANFKGYDISPDMVRLSLVNMYLHGFSDPHIYEYDTLTSLERWNEYADVILANPPFMSPKGGIKPHNRFGMQSKRSEVLFVDYIAEHLTPNGRAGIIVPEGIIFQSQTAYKQLRKMLVEDYLVAVVSLPAGVFNPYSGVKTSILILDKALARQADKIAFFKIENDGFGLGAQRRPIDKNDLPDIQQAIREYMNMDKQDRQDLDSSCASCPSMLKQLLATGRMLMVPKEKIAANGDYNLSGDRYKDSGAVTTRWPLVSLREVCIIESGSRPKGGAIDSGVPSIGGEQIDENGDIRWNKMKYVSKEHFHSMTKGVLHHSDVLIVKDGATTGKTGFFASDIQAAVNEHVFILRANDRVHAYFLFQIVRSPQFQESLRPYVKGIIGGISLEFAKIEIPLPPLEVQKEIVAEIGGYQKVIDGARAVSDNYRPHIPIHPDWPIMEVGDLATPEYGFTASADDEGDARFIRITDISPDGTLRKDGVKYVLLTDEARPSLLAHGDILVARTGATYGKTMIFSEDYPAAFASYLIRLRFAPDRVVPRYYWIFAQSDNYWTQARSLVTGGGQPQFNGNALKQVKVPLPPVNTQETIVAEIEAEQALVAANRELITRMEKKIQATLARVWGEEKTAATEA
ncbi:MAG: N-6 DNA methylase, partial [Anaerolineales bacterium]|nr:N-6 DNA methylase [Anaerolineales bacterium]